MNQPILITGATSGIGKETTSLLTARGHDVFASYRDPRDRAALAEQPGVHPVRLDVSDPDQIAQAVSGIDEVLGDVGLYAVINNAGITYTAPFEYAEPEQVRKVIDVDLMAPFLVTQACLSLLRRHNETERVRARVINVASWAGVMASPFIGSYNAAKYGLIGLSESMHYDLALLGIHVVLANPGVTKTPLHAKTTNAALATLEEMPVEARERYRPYLEHFATMGEGSADSRMLASSVQVAGRIATIVETRKPRFKYNLSIDAKVIDGLVTRLLPFRVRASINRRMYRLEPMVWRNQSEILATATVP
jgi:NAD(P)-dependent dehydrogenase (short-subunit alcohol dehydrogenase family)